VQSLFCWHWVSFVETRNEHALIASKLAMRLATIAAAATTARRRWAVGLESGERGDMRKPISRSYP
jgi:hypothetical protein